MFEILAFVVIFFGLIWLLGAMFAGGKEGGTNAVRGCFSLILWAVVIVIAIAIYIARS